MTVVDPAAADAVPRKLQPKADGIIVGRERCIGATFRQCGICLRGRLKPPANRNDTNLLENNETRK